MRDTVQANLFQVGLLQRPIVRIKPQFAASLIVKKLCTEPNGDAYVAARSRVENHIVQLAQARGIRVSVEVDPGRSPIEVVTDTHQIQLTYGRRRRIMAVDHETFMDDEFFRTLVLHQLQAAVDELAALA
jgi:hypothetical protein